MSHPRPTLINGTSDWPRLRAELAFRFGVRGAEIERWMREAARQTALSTSGGIEALVIAGNFAAVFDSLRAFKRWMNKPHQLLSGESPLAWLRRGRLQEIADFVKDAQSGSPS